LERLNSECAVEICQRYRPLYSLFRPYIRIAYIIDILNILRPYQTLTFSAQNPDELFLSALPDHTLDGPPFILFHPDFDSQNVLVGEDGTIMGIIDWDNVYTSPRQGAAVAYPSWLTVDWDPLFYGWSKDASSVINAGYDLPTELVKYREA
jgi:hypothetical protein